MNAPAPPNNHPRGFIHNYNPSRKSQALLAQAQEVLKEYRDHWPLTIRQIFYRLVGAYDLDKTEKSYQRLIRVLAMGRRARLVPFDAIRDDGIEAWHFGHYADADAFIEDMGDMSRYERDKQVRQSRYVEVHCEAAGMLPQLAEVTAPYSVPVYSSGGFDSITAKYNLARRIAYACKPVIILHLGDYDPSGEAMFHVMQEDAEGFAGALTGGVDVEFRRVALTEAQVAAFDLPTAPTKPTDRRALGWDAETCQLEALAPDQIAELLRHQLDSIFSPAQLLIDRRDEDSERARILEFLEGWDTEP